VNHPELAELLAERFGATPWAERYARPEPHPGRSDGGPDTALNTARRRRELCEALDGVADRDGTRAA
jgi:hypothetical protein